MAERIVRVTLVVVGLALIGYGISRIWDFSTTDQISVIIWLAIALLAHDAVLAPIALAVSWLFRRSLPPWWSRTLLVALAFTNVLVILALPVIAPRPADQGARNSSVLDRDYWLGLGIALLVVWVAVFVGAWWLRSRGQPPRPTPDPALWMGPRASATGS